MGNPFNGWANERREESEVAARASAKRQRIWLRRTLILLVASCTAFALAALWFSRLSTSLSIQEASSQATRVVREQFTALERGDLRGAYAHFSPRYRRHMPFEIFEEMILGHWPMMQGRVKLLPRSATLNRVVVYVDFEDSHGMSAEFTLVRSGGRWWIDDVSWGQKHQQHLILT